MFLGHFCTYLIFDDQQTHHKLTRAYLFIFLSASEAGSILGSILTQIKKLKFDVEE